MTAPTAQRLLLPVLVLASMLGPLSLNILMPSVPGLAEIFAAPRETVQLTLSLFLGGMAISQLLLGTLADRYGRRPVLISAIALFILASLAATFAPTIETLIAARIVQAIGATSGITLARTIIRDLYARDRAASMIGYVTMAFVVAPMAAPAIGGTLDESFGWRAIFVFCGVLGAIALLAIAVVLPETRPATLDRANFGDVVAAGRKLLGERSFLAYSATGALISAVFFSFLGAAPHLVVTEMGLGKSTYALWFMVIGGGYMIGNFLSGRLSQRLGIDRMIVLGNLIGIGGSVILLAAGWYFGMTPAALFLPCIITSFANGLVLPNAIAGSISVNPEAAGAASGLTGFMQMALGGLSSFFAAKLVAPSLVPLAILMLAFAILSALAYRHGTSARRTT